MEPNKITLPTTTAERKNIPMATGLLDYFPAALAEVARVSKAGNDKHNPGEPLHWARGKSMDHADCILRHLADRGTIDPEDGLRHSAKIAWRALALLQEELEKAGLAPLPRGAKLADETQDTGPKFKCPVCGTTEPWKFSLAVLEPQHALDYPDYCPPCNTFDCGTRMERVS